MLSDWKQIGLKEEDMFGTNDVIWIIYFPLKSINEGVSMLQERIIAARTEPLKMF